MHLKNSLLKLICRGKQSEPFGHWNKYLIRVNNNYHREPGTLLCQLIFTNCYFHFSEVEAEGQSHWTYSSHSLCLFHFTSFFLLFFLMWTIFSFCWICYSVASVLWFGFFWPGGIWDLSSPGQGWKPHPLHWATRQVPLPLLFSQSEEESSQLLA